MGWPWRTLVFKQLGANRLRSVLGATVVLEVPTLESNMADTEALLKIRTDVLLAELKTIEALENWGTSLFLAGIALVTKQLVEWRDTVLCPPAASTLTTTDAMLFVPAFIGMTAFLYLRILNYRIRDVRTRLYAPLNPDPGNYPGSYGTLGWAMALMPIVFGIACSYFLVANRPAAAQAIGCTIALSVLLFGAAIVVFVIQSGIIRNKRHNSP